MDSESPALCGLKGDAVFMLNLDAVSLEFSIDDCKGHRVAD